MVGMMSTQVPIMPPVSISVRFTCMTVLPLLSVRTFSISREPWDKVPLTVVDVDAFAAGIAAKSRDVAMRIEADENARGTILVLVLLIAVHMRATSI